MPSLRVQAVPKSLLARTAERMGPARRGVPKQTMQPLAAKMRLGGMPGIRMQQSSRTVRITRIRKMIALYLKAAVQPVDPAATVSSLAICKTGDYTQRGKSLERPRSRCLDFCKRS